ncbi:MAG: DNA cytosine methyltransferase [Bifidobacterium bifidum]
MSGPLTLLSLFTGYGGLDMGVAEALEHPVRTVAVSDIEPGPQAVERYRYPDAIQLGDITRADVTAAGRVDVVAGGSPCQSMSLAGLRAGMKTGTRSGLWSYQRDAVETLHPKLMVWENVLGALSAVASSREDVARADERARLLTARGLCACDNPMFDRPDGFGADEGGEKAKPATIRLRDWYAARGTDAGLLCCTRCGLPLFERSGGRLLADAERLDGALTMPTIRALGRVLGDLTNLGYDAAWRVLAAADCGAPHRRERLFVTAWPRFDATGRGERFASWDADRDIWVTGQDTLFDEPGLFSGSWPRCGMIVDGTAFMLDEKPSTSRMTGLLYTPKARMGWWSRRRRADGRWSARPH